MLALTSVPALLTCSPEANRPQSPDGREITIKEIPGSQLTSIITVRGFTCTADLFIYRDSDHMLEYHRSMNPGDSASINLWQGDYCAVAVTDSPCTFDCTALGSYDSIELLTYNIADDSRPFPIKSATAQFCAGDTLVIDPKPLRSTITLQDVTNSLGNYTRLENPRVYLENANLQAEILRTEGFRPAETGLRTEAYSLPADIGMFTQHPATQLYCYPNDSPTVTQTTPRTVFVFECEIRDSTCRFSCTLPPLFRGETTNLSLSIESENEYICRVL